MALRTCSECPNPLPLTARKDQKTCTPSCRAKRSRRLRRQKVTAKQYPVHLKQMSEAVNHEAPNVAHEVLVEELRPVVREAITEDTLRALDKLVGLTPRMVECIEEDLYSEDATIRQRAYTLLAKYTVGHHAVVQPEDKTPGQQLVVEFNLPRPGAGEVQGHEAAVELEATEVRSCDTCGADKPITEFIANSHRCATCYDELRAKAAAML